MSIMLFLLSFNHTSEYWRGGEGVSVVVRPLTTPVSRLGGWEGT